MHKRSLSSAVRHAALPNEPRIFDPARQAELSERFLTRALPELEAFFLAVRAHVDLQLRPKRPVKLGKVYPLGQCLEITQAVQALLQKLQPDELEMSEPAKAGHAAFAAFRKAGGQFRLMWGDLRGEFFQNAFQMGTFYLDVSNDTVTLTKPKVEIVPFADARFTPVADFQHFARIAQRYWKHAIYPNHLLPELAPYCPLIHVAENGQMLVTEGTFYMVSMTQAGRFEPSEAVLREQAMPAELFHRLAVALGTGGGKLAPGPEEGRAMALRACREHRRKGWHASPKKAQEVIATVQRINQTLLRSHAATLAAEPKKPYTETGSTMNTIDKMQINGITYNLADLSPEAKQRMEMVRATDTRLAELQRDIAIFQTARNTYIAELVKLLPPRQ